MKDKIEVGDRVNIHFGNLDSIYDYEVLYIPFATGDSWKLRNNDVHLIYVQNFSYMELRGKNESK